MPRRIDTPRPKVPAAPIVKAMERVAAARGVSIRRLSHQFADEAGGSVWTLERAYNRARRGGDSATMWQSTADRYRAFLGIDGVGEGDRECRRCGHQIRKTNPAPNGLCDPCEAAVAAEVSCAA